METCHCKSLNWFPHKFQTFALNWLRLLKLIEQKYVINQILDEIFSLQPQEINVRKSKVLVIRNRYGIAGRNVKLKWRFLKNVNFFWFYNEIVCLWLKVHIERT